MAASGSRAQAQDRRHWVADESRGPTKSGTTLVLTPLVMKSPVGSGNSEAYKHGLNMDVLEELCRLNLPSHFPEVAKFVKASWNIAESLKQHIGSLKITTVSPRQKVALFMIGKSQRLLRAIHKLVSSGMWPEAEIVVRTQLEAKALLNYVLEGTSQERAKEWLSNSDRKKYWPFKKLTKGGMAIFRSQYSDLSLYLHNHVLSSQGYIGFGDDGNFFMEVGPLGNGDSLQIASELLGNVAMMNGAICEMARYEFARSEKWEAEHESLMQLPYFKAQQPGVEEILKTQEGQEFLRGLANQGVDPSEATSPAPTPTAANSRPIQ